MKVGIFVTCDNFFLRDVMEKCKSICDMQRFLEWYYAAKVGIFVTCDNFFEEMQWKNVNPYVTYNGFLTC